jgi:hypothetical protein
MRLPSFILPLLLFCALAATQLTLFVRPMAEVPGPTILFGTDTVSHDAVVHLWIQQHLSRDPFTIPLWMPELQGGLPTVGAFLWTPLAPATAPYLFLPYPAAQRLAWILSLAVAGLGAWLLARAEGLRQGPAILAGIAWMLSGHVVTLIHAGHFQKVMALGWLPWMVAGASLIARRRRGSRGAVALAMGFGLMFLSGHPQIAYLGLMLSAARVSQAWSRVRYLWFAGAVAVGGLIAAPQFLPGVEMAGWSNRAGGVAWEEAIATSYPPGEIMEYVVPRWKGSSVQGDQYHGEWGERIVSDYAGLLVVLLAAVGLLARTGRFWGPAGLFFLLIGLGKHTPLYGTLYAVLPGFSSFRSPGTFMAGTALAIAVLSAAGSARLLAVPALRRHGRRILLGAALLIAGDLARANRHFLLALPWESYQQDYAGPNELDLWLSDGDRALHVHDAASELSIRPILFGRRALLGYHPIALGVRDELNRTAGLGTLEWFHQNGIRWITVSPQFQGLPEGTEFFPQASRAVVPVPDATGLVQGASSFTWLERTPNRRIFRAHGTTLRVVENWTPGWHLSGLELSAPDGPATEWILPLSGAEVTVTMTYRPTSWKVGIFLGAMGLVIIGFLLGNAGRPGTTANPKPGGPLPLPRSGR